MLHQLRYFLAVVKYHNFTEAAEACHISQSAISQQIKALEHGLGVDLLIRKNRSFDLTPAGKIFYKKGVHIMEDYEDLVKEVSDLAK